jgi:predicted metal-binding membrane protein
MFPAVAPAATLWMRSVAVRSAPPVAWARIAAFLSGYLVAWTGYGLVALAAGRSLARLVSLAGSSASPWIGTAILGVAGIYQMTPLKERCLRRCRSALGQVLWWAGLRGGAADFRAGLSNGAWCVACCWGLMAVLLVTGIMNLAAMAALAGAVFAEKVWRHGRIAARLTGVALLGMAVLAPVSPWLAPGLRSIPGGSM